MPDSAASPDRDFVLARGLLRVSLGISAVLGVALAAREPRALPLVGLLALALGATWPGAAAWRRTGANPGWLVALAVLNVALLIPEIGLRLAGFRYEAGTQFGYPRPSQFTPFEPHEQLFWTFRPSDPGINSWGFVGREVEVPKPTGVFRVLALGDSCSESGYPERLERRLAERDAAPRVEVTRLATSGYTSHQGRVAAELYASAVAPDLALLYFGWNDHWRAYGAADADKRVRLPDAAIDRVYARLVRYSRVVGLAGWLRDALRGGAREPSSFARVSPQQYRENLRAIAQHLREGGAEVVLVTAPTSFYRFGVPGYVTEARLAPDAATAVADHRAYNEIVRALARESGTPVLDLEVRLDALPDPELQRIFRRDGIHFTDAGADFVAAEVVAMLSRERLLP